MILLATSTGTTGLGVVMMLLGTVLAIVLVAGTTQTGRHERPSLGDSDYNTQDPVQYGRVEQNSAARARHPTTAVSLTEEREYCTQNAVT